LTSVGFDVALAERTWIRIRTVAIRDTAVRLGFVSADLVRTGVFGAGVSVVAVFDLFTATRLLYVFAGVIRRVTHGRKTLCARRRAIGILTTTGTRNNPQAALASDTSVRTARVAVVTIGIRRAASIRLEADERALLWLGRSAASATVAALAFDTFAGLTICLLFATIENNRVYAGVCTITRVLRAIILIVAVRCVGATTGGFRLDACEVLALLHRARNAVITLFDIRAATIDALALTDFAKRLLDAALQRAVIVVESDAITVRNAALWRSTARASQATSTTKASQALFDFADVFPRCRFARAA
jgi:hypothetical protein